jgi:hypothetical protein
MRLLGVSGGANTYEYRHYLPLLRRQLSPEYIYTDTAHYPPPLIHSNEYEKYIRQIHNPIRA